MPETAAKTTNPRARSRSTAAKTAATKAAPPKPADDGRQKLTFSLAYIADTKSYSTWDLSKDVDANATGCVGKLYAPLGTEEVKVLVVGPVMGDAE